MLEYLSFTICKSNGASITIAAYLDYNGFYIEVMQGSYGIYVSTSINRYHYSSENTLAISKELEKLKINCWPKSIPKDYSPRKHFMGCDINSWHLDYRKKGQYSSHSRKRIIPHIASVFYLANMS